MNSPELQIMPELPEVETTLRGVAPHLKNQMVRKVVVRNPNLRWPVPLALSEELPGQQFASLSRRAKYLLFETGRGCLMIHLGMSGRLRIVAGDLPVEKHDHVDIELGSGQLLRYTDPRRFGSILWFESAPSEHPLLAQLGPEPLDEAFSGGYLFEKSRGRKLSIKQFLMDNKVVVGVGNIYANEALFGGGVHPATPCGKVSKARYRRLSDEVKRVIEAAITQGGTTLRDFVNGEGKPGYFQQQLQVYGRGGQPCRYCKARLKEIRQGQRATVYCPRCQR